MAAWRRNVVLFWAFWIVLATTEMETTERADDWLLGALTVRFWDNLNVPNSKCDRSLKLRSSLEWLVSIVWLLFWYRSSGVQKSDWDESVGFCANLCNSQLNAWNKILVNSQSYLLVLVWFGSVELQSMDSWNDKWLKACVLPKWKSSRYGQKGKEVTTEEHHFFGKCG